MISVLMPVYNVEKYIEKTLESVKNQTYTDFEVIMVDDGSTDKSGAICDKWVKEDARFRVIHTENQGVSAARNTALSNVGGEYIFFMDSDDLIEPDTFEILLKALTENSADMAMANFYYTDNQGNPIDKLNSTSPVKDEVVSCNKYLNKLTQNNANYYCTSTNKVFKSSLFEEITYPVGKINEDEARIHEIIFKCEKIVTLSKRTYNYIKHETGITGTPYGIKNLDREDAFVGRINFFKEQNLNDLAQKAAIFALDSAIVTLSKCIKNNLYYGNTKKRVEGYFKFFVENCPSFAKLTSFEKKVYIIGWAVVNFPSVYTQYIQFNINRSNMGTAEAVKEEVFNFIMKCFSLFPAKNVIVFESHPDMACNTYPVYKYLLEQGLNEKYKFVWLCEDKSKFNEADYKNHTFINQTQKEPSFFGKIKTMHTVATAKALVYSNQLLGQHGKNKFSLWLQHGMPLKASNGTYCIKNDCTNALCVSEFFADNYSADARVDKEKMIFMGFPRNDLLLTENKSIEKCGFEGFSKIIFWLPTFRQRVAGAKNKKVADYEMSTNGTGIPAIDTAEQIAKVNTYLKALNILLVLKPHPVQDLSVMQEMNFSNFRIINDDFLRKNGVQLYELLGKCDAMITDYSSVYYDYLLTDKPIGLTIGDIDEYIAKRGFVYKNPLEILKGEHILDTDGLIDFIGNISNGYDKTKEERTVIKNKIHKIQKPESAKMVGDFILQQIAK